MAKEMFPELARKTTMEDLCELKIKKIIHSLQDEIRVIQCEDANGELHEITFQSVDASYIAVKLDDQEVANLLTEV